MLEGLVGGEIPPGHLRPLQSGLGPGPISAAHQLTELGILGQVLDSLREYDRLTRADQQAVDSMFHELRYPAHRAADNGKTRGKRLGENVAEGLRRRRQGEEVCRAVALRHGFAAQRSTEANLRGNPELLREVLQQLPVRTLSDDLQLEPFARKERKGLDELAEALPLHQSRYRDTADRSRLRCSRGGLSRVEQLQVYPIGDDAVSLARTGPLRQPAQALADGDESVGPAPDPAGKGGQQPVEPLHHRVIGVIPRNIGSTKRHNDGNVADAYERKQGTGREGEEDVNGIILVGAEQMPHQRKRMP